MYHPQLQTHGSHQFPWPGAPAFGTTLVFDGTTGSTLDEHDLDAATDWREETQ